MAANTTKNHSDVEAGVLQAQNPIILHLGLVSSH